MKIEPLTMDNFWIACSRVQGGYGEVWGFELQVTPKWRQCGIQILNSVIGDTLWGKYGGDLEEYQKAIDNGEELEYKMVTWQNKDEDYWSVSLIWKAAKKTKK